MSYPLTIQAQGELEVVMQRTFDAPRELVFDAWTKPELLRQWLGVHNGWTMPVCEIDLRVGGNYRYEWHPPRPQKGPASPASQENAGPCSGAEEGKPMVVRGVFRKIVAPECIVATERFDDAWYPGESLITHVLEEEGGKTTSTITMHYESKEARDAVLASPMESGVSAGYEVLDRLLATLLASRTQEGR